MKKDKSKINYVKPKLYHTIIKQIEKTIDKIVKDERSLDRTFFKDFIKNSEPILSDKHLQKSNDSMSKGMVEGSGIYLISNLILQMTLFHRIIRNDSEGVPMYPKDNVPFYMRQTDSKGKDKDFWDLHSLYVMKKYYDKEDKTINELMED
jgi:hypothetical protein|tara:strand:- start:3756 stop:4205 length:450 start_codon:yes stop_codon:yes gene_type:complete